MSAFSLNSAFILFFAVIGPPKVLLAFAHVAKERDPAALRRLTLVASLIAAVVGVGMAFAAEFLTSFFHISDESLQLAGGVIFFIYAVALVLGVHLGNLADEDEEDGLQLNPLATGLRELLLPFIASPVAITAVLVESLEKDTFGWHLTIASAYVAVVVIDCLCVLALSTVLGRTHYTSLQVFSRLLGLLLAAVGVELFLTGLESLGVHFPDTGH